MRTVCTAKAHSERLKSMAGTKRISLVFRKKRANTSKLEKIWGFSKFQSPPFSPVTLLLVSIYLGSSLHLVIVTSLAPTASKPCAPCSSPFLSS